MVVLDFRIIFPSRLLTSYIFPTHLCYSKNPVFIFREPQISSQRINSFQYAHSYRNTRNSLKKWTTFEQMWSFEISTRTTSVFYFLFHPFCTLFPPTPFLFMLQSFSIIRALTPPPRQFSWYSRAYMGNIFLKWARILILSKAAGH